MKWQSSPLIGTCGPTGTLGDLIDSPLPALLKLFHRLQRGLAASGDLGRDVPLAIALGHRKFYCLTRADITRSRASLAASSNQSGGRTSLGWLQGKTSAEILRSACRNAFSRPIAPHYQGLETVTRFCNRYDSHRVEFAYVGQPERL